MALYGRELTPSGWLSTWSIFSANRWSVFSGNQHVSLWTEDQMKRLSLFTAVFITVTTVVYAEKPIQIATDVWIPYENISNKEAPGFSTEVVQSVFANLKKEVEFKEYP